MNDATARSAEIESAASGQAHVDNGDVAGNRASGQINFTAEEGFDIAVQIAEHIAGSVLSGFDDDQVACLNLTAHRDVVLRIHFDGIQRVQAAFVKHVTGVDLDPAGVAGKLVIDIHNTGWTDVHGSGSVKNDFALGSQLRRSGHRIGIRAGWNDPQNGEIATGSA